MDTREQAAAIDAYCNDPKNIEDEPNFKRRRNKAILAMETGPVIPTLMPEEDEAKPQAESQAIDDVFFDADDVARDDDEG